MPGIIESIRNLDIPATFNLQLTLTVLLIAVSQFNFGFDQQGFNTTQAMDAFARSFGTYNEATDDWYLESWWLSLFTGLPYIGFGVGIIIGSSVSKNFGRRMCMFTMSLWSIIATTIIITSKNRDQILAARILAYIYIGMELAVVPIYQSEITPKKARGFVVSTYQLCLAVGGLVVNCVARGTGSIQSPAAYRIIYGLFYVVPTIVASLIWFVPESPRWLVLKGDREKALRALTRLRKGKFTEEEINAEMEEICAAVDRDGEKSSRMIDAVNDRTNFTRTAIISGACFLQHATGALFGSIFGALYVRSLNFINPFSVTATTSSIMIVTVLICMFLSDTIGRRNVLFIGITIQMCGLFTLGGLGTIENPSNSVKSGLVAGLCLMVLGFSLGWGPISTVLCAEIPTNRLRDVSYRIASIINVVTQFTVAFSLPYLLNPPYANLKSKVGFIFGGMAIVSLVFVYFCVPECKGRTLEEIDLLFASGVPLRHFQKVNLNDLRSASPKLGQDEEDVKDVAAIEVEQKK